VTALIKVGEEWYPQGSDEYYNALEPTPQVDTARVIATHFFCKQRQISSKSPGDSLLNAIVKAGLKLRIDE
jgi:hypothetical protein